MTEPVIKYRDSVTKRSRRLTSACTEEAIKKRISGKSVSHVIYTGEEGEDLTKVKKKLIPTKGCNLQIRDNKIYEIRKRMTRNEILTKTMKQTIEILKEKKLLKTESSTEDIFKSVLNSFLGGAIKPRYTIKNILD